MSTNGKLYPNRWLEHLDSMVEPDNKGKWVTFLIILTVYTAMVGLNSGLMSALMVAYLVPMILVVLIVACTTLDYLVDRAMSAK